jgi:predicted O-linked N-acetylglucosamine transferase (SPINDLY family)
MFAVINASLLAREDPEQALKLLADLINRDPTNVEAWLAAGEVLKNHHEFVQAIGIYRRILALDSSHEFARQNLVLMLIQVGALSEAEVLVDQIIAAEPQSPDAWALLATLRKNQVRDADAADALRRSIALRPDPIQYSNVLHVMQYADDVDPQGLLTAHRHWNETYAANSSCEPPQAAHRYSHSKLRLGFVSSDLGRHPTGFLALTPLECIDKSKVSIVCYYDRLDADSHTERFRAISDSWHISHGWSDDQLLNQIRADQIDILFDMMGHSGTRLLCFARRPAPLQITWLGYVGTTGLSAMDYILADRFHIRPGEGHFYTERVLRMPNAYACYGGLPDDAPEVGPLPAPAAGHFTFGCFNNAAKFSQPIIDAWAEILRRVPDARLLLKTHGLGQEKVRDRLHAGFAVHGIPPQRVLMEGQSPHRELLAAYGRVDLALDTQPYSGGLTTCESLWMGVPVITFPGKTFAGRHSTSYLNNAGFPGFVAANAKGYIDLAVQWANRLEDLSAIRSRMRNDLRSSAVCDAPRFANDLLALLIQVWSASRTDKSR